MRFINIALIAFAVAQKITQRSYPIGVVTSDSMSPSIHRGDLLLTIPSQRPPRLYDVVVFQPPLCDTPPVAHRIIAKRRNAHSQTMEYLTQGDNNVMDDGYGNLYPGWLQADQIQATVRGIIPFVGWPSVLLAEHWWIKYALMASVVIDVLFTI